MNKLTKYITLPIVFAAGSVMVIGIAAENDSEPGAGDESAQTVRQAIQDRREHTAGPRYACSRTIEASASNPDSLEWVDRMDWPTIWSEDGGIYVDATFRGENAFGGVVTQTVTCTVKEQEGNHRVVELK